MDREKDINKIIDKAIAKKQTRLNLGRFITTERMSYEIGCKPGQAEEIIDHLLKRNIIYVYYRSGLIRYYLSRYKFYPTPGRTIDLPKNLFAFIDPVISLLQETQLCVSITHLSDKILAIPGLTHLDLSYTNIAELPQWMEKLTNLAYLDLENTKIPLPPEVIKNKNNHREILNYYFTNIVTGETTQPLREGKLIFVGE